MDERSAPWDCGLAAAVGRSERCPVARCPLWEAGEQAPGAGHCSIERLVPHLTARPELAWYLLELRASLRELEDERRGEPGGLDS